MKKGNPHPRTDQLTPLIRADSTKDPLASSITGVRLSVRIDKEVRSLPNRTAWLRRVITEAAERELMNQENTDDE